MWGTLQHRGHKHGETRGRQQSLLCHHLQSFQEGNPNLCFLNPSWMFSFNATNKDQKCPKLQTIPQLDEVNKSSWDKWNKWLLTLKETSYSGPHPALDLSFLHLTVTGFLMRFRITYFALPLKFLSLWLMSSSVGPFSLPAGPTLLVPMVLLQLRTCTCSLRPCSRAMSLQCFQHLRTPFT